MVVVPGVYDSCPHGTTAPWYTFPEAQWTIVPAYALNTIHWEYCAFLICGGFFIGIGQM